MPSQFSVQQYTSYDQTTLRYGVLNNPESNINRPLIYIAGLGGSIKNALHFLEQLLSVFNPIYGVDLRGFGLNTNPLALHNTHHFLPDLQQFYRHVESQETSTPYLAGISLGGVLATLLAQKSNQFKGLLLWSPAYQANPQTFSWRYRSQQIFKVLWPQAQITLPYGLEHLTRNPRVLNDPQHQGILPFKFKPSFLWSLRKLCQQSLKATHTLNTPTLMIIPKQDLVCCPNAMRLGFQQIPHPVKHCLEYDLYHEVFLEAEHPEIAKDMTQWITETLLPDKV